MPRLVTKTGDATRPGGSGNRIVCHVCNDIGTWGAGFVVALSRRWPEPEEAYREWHASGSHPPLALGEVQFVQVEEDVWVANMVAQRGTRPSDGTSPIRYDALERCLRTAARRAGELDASLHMPRIGAGLAGGDWGRIRTIIAEAIAAADVRATVWELEGRPSRRDAQGGD